MEFVCGTIFGALAITIIVMVFITYEPCDRANDERKVDRNRK